VVVFENRAPTFAQRFDALVDGVGDEADEATGNEDAGERDDERKNAGGPGSIGGKGSGVENT
jgi:hypothetical protein